MGRRPGGASTATSSASGHTQVPGESHAEVEALRHAGERARGATMVVTLEPCCHVGTNGTLRRGDHRGGYHAGRGGRRSIPTLASRDVGWPRLRAAGVDVEVGVEIEAVRAQLAPYLWHRVTGRPYVVLKVAATLDGVVAMADGSSQWITGEEARRDAHVLRAQSQAIVVGANTVRLDDPALTARLGRRDPGAAARGPGSRARGRQGAPVSGSDRANSAHCSTSSANTISCRCSSKAAPRWRARSSRRDW